MCFAQEQVCWAPNPSGLAVEDLGFLLRAEAV